MCIYNIYCLVRACGAAGKAEEALSLLDSMLEKKNGEGGLQPDAFCFNVCISAADKAGLYEKAMSLLTEMQSAGVKPDVVRCPVK